MTDSEKAYFSDMYEQYAKLIYRICLLYMKNQEDAEEAVTDVFIRLMEKRPAFKSKEHEKAWLLRVSVNLCKNTLSSGWRKKVVHDEEAMLLLSNPQNQSILEEVLSLPPIYRIVIYMHYYEGYKVREIAEILNTKESAVLSRLARGRRKLKDILTEGGCFYAHNET